MGFWLWSYLFDREERDRYRRQQEYRSPSHLLAPSSTGGAIPCPLCYKGHNGSYGKVVCPVDESPRMYQPVEKVPAEPIDGPESGSERPKGGFRRLNGSQKAREVVFNGPAAILGGS
jgi:hypothetical protein